MFDWVVDVPVMKCVKCGAELYGWQSKSGPCDLAYIPFYRLDNFYNPCENCGLWHEYQLTDDPYPARNYELIVRGE